MQVTETLSEGLKREFKVNVPASELDAKVNARLDELKARVRIDGFRPGKVPVSHLKRVYGRSAMAEVIEATVRDTNNQIVSERGYKLAADPKVTLPTEQEAVEKLITGQSDLDYTMAVEIVPPIELTDFKTIKLTRLTSEVTDAEVDEALTRISEQNKPYSAKGEGEKAAKDDRVVISFAGTIDGTPFEGWIGKRWGRHFIIVDQALRKRAGVAVGDVVELVVSARRPEAPAPRGPASGTRSPSRARPRSSAPARRARSRAR